MREVQLVKESKILKIDPVKRLFSRFDKTVYIEEPIPSEIAVTGDTIVYVESSSFFALSTEIKSISIQATLCSLSLKNGGKYDLPFEEGVEWESKQFVPGSQSSVVKIKLAAGRLSSVTLKNLANPLLQCIYIDASTAVSCNSEVACIDGNVTSDIPILLPPDVIDFVEGKEVKINIVGTDYVLEIGAALVFVPTPQLDYSEIANTLRNTLPSDVVKYPVGKLFDSIKRLGTFSDYVIFNGTQVVCQGAYEPFSFPCANDSYQYNAQFLLTVLPHVKTITQTEFALLAYGDMFLFMISPVKLPDKEVEEEGAQ